jgi:hypothetical protein
VKDGIARVFFTVDEIYMVLLHGFIKKSPKAPASDLETAFKKPPLEPKLQRQGAKTPKRKHISRAMLDRVLDPEKESTLSSLAQAARAVGKRLELSLV